MVIQAISHLLTEGNVDMAEWLKIIKVMIKMQSRDELDYKK